MAKMKRIRAPPPRPPLPRNTVTLWLDGNAHEFAESFKQCQAHYYYWILCRAGFRVRHGNRLLFTTPLDGTFYYVVRYNGQYVVFVIVARPAWLIGFCTAKGFFEVKSSEIDGFYMDSSHTKELKFDGNHKAISPDGTGNTIVNLHTARRHFHELCKCQTKSRNMDLPEVAPALGFYVIVIMEPKLKEIFHRHCYAIVDTVDVRLGNDWVKRAINNWSAGSQQALHSTDNVDYQPHDCGLMHLKCLDDILGMFFYLHIDAYNSGMFSHEPLDPEPRKLTWELVDEGSGDGDIITLQEPSPHNIGHIACRGARKRQSANLVESSSDNMGRKKRKGLSGGGLGGPPEAPNAFLEWAESDNNAQTCGNLIAHLASMDLKVLDSKREAIFWPLKRKGVLEAVAKDDSKQAEQAVVQITSESFQHLGNLEEVNAPGTIKEAADTTNNVMSETTNKSKNTGICSIDLESLGAEQFITDAVIDVGLKTLSTNLRRSGIENILLVRPAVCYLLCTGSRNDVTRTVQQLQLSTRRVVLFPVNNNTNVGQADGGSHWSLLVLDQWTKHQPRLIHYDSAGITNIQRAKHLEAIIQPSLADSISFTQGLTPQQENGYDCGLYLLNIARVICRWCEVHAGPGTTAGTVEDWSTNLWSEVNAKSARSLRNMFRTNLEKHLSDKNTY